MLSEPSNPMTGGSDRNNPMVLTKKERLPIIAFAPNEWQGPWFNRQQLLSRLATRGWPVVYSTGALSVWDRHKPKWKTANWLMRFEETDGVLLAHPGRSIPRWPRAALLDRMAIRCYSRRLERISRVGTERNIIAYLFHPSYLPYVEHLKAKYIVFHAYDAYSKFPSWTPELKELLADSMEQSDLILASSEAIARTFQKLDQQKNIRILHNAVDEKLFRPKIASPCPDDLGAIPRPRIGYIGTVNEKFDFELVAKLAAQRTDWHWVIIGPHKRSHSEESFGATQTDASWDLIQIQSNVHFLGPKDMRELPAYANHMDVNVMCYRTGKDGWWAAVDPLKCYEYLAVGRPIVSANIESVRRFSSVLEIAPTLDKWIVAIERALTSGGVGTPERRRAVALENTWDKRVDQLEDWLFEMIGVS